MVRQTIVRKVKTSLCKRGYEAKLFCWSQVWNGRKDEAFSLVRGGNRPQTPTELPEDVLKQIFDWAAQSPDVSFKTLQSFCLVSKAVWQWTVKYLYSTVTLYDTYHAFAFRRTLVLDSDCVLGPLVRSLIYGSTGIGGPGIESITSWTPNLRHFRMPRCRDPRQLVLGAPVPGLPIEHLSIQAMALTFTLDPRNLAALTHLELQIRDPREPLPFAAMLQLKSLTHLALDFCIIVSDAQSSRLISDTTATLSLLFHHLKFIVILLHESLFPLEVQFPPSLQLVNYANVEVAILTSPRSPLRDFPRHLCPTARWSNSDFWDPCTPHGKSIWDIAERTRVPFQDPRITNPSN